MQPAFSVTNCDDALQFRLGTLNLHGKLRYHAICCLERLYPRAEERGNACIDWVGKGDAAVES